MLGFLNELVQCIVFNFISVAINPFKILTIEKWDATQTTRTHKIFGVNIFLILNAPSINSIHPKRSSRIVCFGKTASLICAVANISDLRTLWKQASVGLLVLQETELSPRQVAVTFTVNERYCLSEAATYQIFKAHDLIIRSAFITHDLLGIFHAFQSRKQVVKAI